MKPPATSHQAPGTPRSGFTLIEMLVATALVVLMMLLFAQVFGTAVGTMREQQSMAQNDKKARSFETTLRNDLSNLTYRQPRAKGVAGLVPLMTNWPVDAERQVGYFYVSENDVESATDDVLQFTVWTDLATKFRGRAAAAGGPNDRNQPDYDDGVYGNNVGESPAAEVVYFLRGGNLYRRQMLLRQPPLPTVEGGPAEFSAQPGRGLTGVDGTAIADSRLFQPGYAGGTGNFWTDFDYSAWAWWRDDGDGDPLNGTDEWWLMFNGVDSLQNTPGATPFPIAHPAQRFGHRPRLDGVDSAIYAGAPYAGQPLEFLLPPSGTNRDFIGRFTHEETSDSDFLYPGSVPALGTSPMNYQHPFGTAPDDNGNLIIDPLEGGSRAGEDIILSNVESFDIQVWDDGFAEQDWDPQTSTEFDRDINGNSTIDLYPAQWVNLGHQTTVDSTVTGLGWFSAFKNTNRVYGPRESILVDLPGADNVDDDLDGVIDNNSEIGFPGTDDTSFNNCFDTWHSTAAVGVGTTRIDTPPFRSVRILKSTGIEWFPGDPVNYSTVYFPGVEDLNNNQTIDPSPEDTIIANGILDPGEDTNGNGILDGLEDRNGNGILEDDDSYFYRPIKVYEDFNGNRVVDTGEDADGDGILEGYMGARRPEWPREPGAIVTERFDVDGDGFLDESIVWQCFDNRVGLQMIRIVVRYRDVGTGLPRQVSIVHSFVE